MIRIFATAASIAVLSAATSARADDPVKVLKAMAEKVQFTSSGELKMNRPEKLRIRRTGGYADVELVYDGKLVSLYGNNARSYVQADLAGTVDQMIDTLQARSGAGLPGADLLLSNSYDQLIANVVEGKHIGQSVVAGDRAGDRCPGEQ